MSPRDAMLWRKQQKQRQLDEQIKEAALQVMVFRMCANCEVLRLAGVTGATGFEASGRGGKAPR